MTSSTLVRPVSIVPKGQAYCRFIEALAHGDGSGASYAYAQQWRDTPQIERAFALATKAVVPGATTLDSTWAAPLAQAGITEEALTIARDTSVFGAAQARMRRVPDGVPVPRELDPAAVAGGWAPEGTSIGPIAYAFDTLTLRARKIQTFAVVALELLVATPVTQPVITQATIGTLMRRIDTLFLDPTQTDPASITANGTEITSTGTSAAQILGDLEDMLAAITTSGAALSWVLGRKTAAHLALMLGGAGADLPRSLLSLPVILSAHAQGQITLADFGEIAFVDDGAFAVSVSRQGTVEMLDNPTNNSATATPTTTVSLFQTNSAGLRTTRWLNWEVVRTGGSPAVQAVAWMTVSY